MVTIRAMRDRTPVRGITISMSLRSAPDTTVPA